MSGLIPGKKLKLMQDLFDPQLWEKKPRGESQSDIENLDGRRIVKNGMCKEPGWSEHLSSRGMEMWDMADMAGSHRTLES
jgi:hypothetical protein